MIVSSFYWDESPFLTGLLETSHGCRSGLYFRNLDSVTLICLSLYHCHTVSVICNFIESLEIRFLSPSIFSLFLDCFAESLGLPYTVLTLLLRFWKRLMGLWLQLLWSIDQFEGNRHVDNVRYSYSLAWHISPFI